MLGSWDITHEPLVIGMLVGGIHVCARVSSSCSGTCSCGRLVVTQGADRCDRLTHPAWLNEHLQGGVGSRGTACRVRACCVHGLAALTRSSFFSSCVLGCALGIPWVIWSLWC